MNETSEKTEVLQTVVPVAVGDEIRKDAGTEDRSISNVIARVLWQHYKKRVGLASHRKAA